jgi:hypothetical protein
MSLGRSADKMISFDQTGPAANDVVLYDARHNMVFNLPKLERSTVVWSYTPIAVADNTLYLIEMCPGPNYWSKEHSFKALIHGKPPDDGFGRPGWNWHKLPPAASLRR